MRNPYGMDEMMTIKERVMALEQDREALLEELAYYKDSLKEEKRKNAVMASRLAQAQEEVKDLDFKLKRIKNNPVWKASKPLRMVMHFFIRTYHRIRGCGNLKGVVVKIRNKMQEKKAMKQHGLASFPDEARRKAQSSEKFSKDITFSILVPLYNTPEKFLRQMIDSVLAQTYQKWELCLADGSDETHAYVGKICQEYKEKDNRIVYRKLEKNEGISGNTNACFRMATGSYIGLFDHDDLLHPSVLYEYMKVICEQDADYIYCDEVTFKGKSIDNMITLHFKPDFAIDNLRANNYICHFSVFARTLLEGTELFRSRFDGSQDHDMILRLTGAAKKVVHIPKILYYWRSHKGSVASDISAKTYAIEAARGAVADHLLTNGYQNFEITSTRAFETIFRIKYELAKQPMVSVIIANKNHKSDLSRCVNSILDKSTYENYEIIIVENNSDEDDIKNYYEDIVRHPKISVVSYADGFNYSAINNLGALHAKGDYLLLLNNDTEVITPDWMEELLMYATREDVGVVGAKLYYEDYTVQHAGIVIGLGRHRTAGHTHYKVPKENVGYMGRLCYAQDVTAVTGACMMVSKKLYDELGGLDEEFAVALNDVDFCMRVREKGYLNVFTPFAELFHYESKSRGSDLDTERAQRYQRECDRFKEKWQKQLAAGDPYYNVNFSLDYSDFRIKS